MIMTHIMTAVKRFRINLRTVVIIAPIIVAMFGMLWRCGVIDYQKWPILSAKTIGRRLRVCYWYVEINPDRCSLHRVLLWKTKYPINPDDPYYNQQYFYESMQRNQTSHAYRSKHDWNSHDWEPWLSDEIYWFNIKTK